MRINDDISFKLDSLNEAIERIGHFKGLINVAANGAEYSNGQSVEDCLWFLNNSMDSIYTEIVNSYTELYTTINSHFNGDQNQENHEDLNRVVHSWITESAPVYTSEK